MTAPALRPRSGPELIDAAFVVFRSHYTELVAAMSAFLVPAAVLALLFPADLGTLAELVFRLMSIPAGGAAIVIASDSYIGREVSVGRAVRAATSRWLSLWGAGIMQGLIAFVGFLLLIIPGFIFFAWAFAMPQIVMLEGSGASESFTRSRELARGNVLRILGTIGLTTLVVFILVAALGLVIGAVGGMAVSGQSRLVDAASNVIFILVYPVVPVVSTLLYYDQRIRKEGFDLELLAQSLDAAPAGGTRPPARRS